MTKLRRTLVLALFLMATGPALALASTMYAVQYNGVSRQYLLYLPSCYADVALPLVVALHGNNAASSGSGMETQSGFSNVAEQQCFLAAYPYAANGIWDPVGDVGFVQAVVADIENRFVVNADRVFLVGHSGGAQLAGSVACAWSSAIAALAQVSYDLRAGDARNCSSAPAKPVLIMHGTGDTRDPYNGNPTINQMSASDTAAYWAGKYGSGVPFVSEFPMTLDNGQTQIGQLSTWAAPVRFYTFTGGGHPFPSSHPQPYRSSNGGPTVTVIGNETVDPGANVIWTFFRSQ